MSFAAKINTIWWGRKGPGKDEEGTAAAEADRRQNGLKETERGQVRPDKIFPLRVRSQHCWKHSIGLEMPVRVEHLWCNLCVQLHTEHSSFLLLQVLSYFRGLGEKIGWDPHEKKKKKKGTADINFVIHLRWWKPGVRRLCCWMWRWWWEVHCRQSADCHLSLPVND